MAELITSAYDGPQITVDELMSDPTYIPTRIIEDLDNAFVEDLFFRQAEDNKGVVAFREAAGNYLGDDAEEIAEYGEIPVSAPELGNLKAAFGIKTGEAIRVSYEQRNENKIDAVTRAIDALERTVVRHGINAVFGAFTAADVPELTASAPWSTGDPAIPAVCSTTIRTLFSSTRRRSPSCCVTSRSRSCTSGMSLTTTRCTRA